MSRDPTEDLIVALARDAQPVRRVASLRWEIAGVGGSALAMVLALVKGRGLRPPGLELLQGPTPFALIAVGLLVAGFAAIAGALAFTRPGREPTGWMAAMASGLALLLCAGAAALLMMGSATAGEPVWGGLREVPCVLTSIVLSVPLALLVTYLAASAAPLHPVETVLLAAAGATALGTLAGHLTCRTPGAWHVVITHAMTPLVGGILLAIPLRSLLRRWARAV